MAPAGHSEKTSQEAIPVVAHRGNAGEFPENTLPAIKSAIALGAPWVEFDVQLSSDGIPFVIHDADLSRTAGLPYPVLESPACELAARSVHEPARFGDRYAGTNVPLLSEVVALLQEARDVSAFVEVKRASINRHGTEAAMTTVLKAIEPIRDRSVVISFSEEAVRYARTKHRRIGLVLEAYDADSRLKADALGPEFLFCNVRKLPPDAAPLWPGRWQWVLYEIDTFELAQRLGARGTYLVETMQVASMIESFRRTAS